uniref:Kinesin motor domain-containing protein n=1 Tax=Chromera velia CCMP2878 TaxID=1169474 RepID=A0A0G4HE64_9ALVE|eukprot:Cvel_26652.t1-p1 / transcript=Cvel_26652.t1 / gene=Cvel_26652 / organism=Chromera_velia_CCMP2878 / gene_product=Kinesin-like protein KIF21B, putative / transcript_product=Kinesin-like protein KIF21B, putative / location=Cvel_scaffold3206:4209-16525(+) / protein_length=1454 / sequence_SO=supercontig / SO=protein_coding / is_pseudo=false
MEATGPPPAFSAVVRLQAPRIETTAAQDPECHVNVVSLDPKAPNVVTIVDPLSEGHVEHSYSFSRVFPSSSDAKTVFDEVGTVPIEALLEPKKGLSATFISYGDSGTCKREATFGGSASWDGQESLASLSLKHLFSGIRKMPKDSRPQVTISFFEVFLDEIRDANPNDGQGGDSMILPRGGPSSPPSTAGESLRGHGMSHSSTDVERKGELNERSLSVHEDSRGEVYVRGLAWGSVASPEEGLKRLRAALGHVKRQAETMKKQREVGRSPLLEGCTPGEREAMTSIAMVATLEHPTDQTDWEAVGKGKAPESASGRARTHLCILDLAGSERRRQGVVGADGSDKEKEKEIMGAAASLQRAVATNSAVASLGKVLQSLAEASLEDELKGAAAGESTVRREKENEQRVHVPYREAKLTRALQPYLQPRSSIVTLVGFLSPLESAFEESRNTLAFLDRVQWAGRGNAPHIVVAAESKAAEKKRLVKRLEGEKATLAALIEGQRTSMAAEMRALGEKTLEKLAEMGEEDEDDDDPLDDEMEVDASLFAVSSGKGGCAGGRGDGEDDDEEGEEDDDWIGMATGVFNAPNRKKFSRSPRIMNPAKVAELLGFEHLDGNLLFLNLGLRLSERDNREFDRAIVSLCGKTEKEILAVRGLLNEQREVFQEALAEERKKAKKAEDIADEVRKDLDAARERWREKQQKLRGEHEAAREKSALLRACIRSDEKEAEEREKIANKGHQEDLERFKKSAEEKREIFRELVASLPKPLSEDLERVRRQAETLKTERIFKLARQHMKRLSDMETGAFDWGYMEGIGTNLPRLAKKWGNADREPTTIQPKKKPKTTVELFKARQQEIEKERKEAVEDKKASSTDENLTEAGKMVRHFWQKHQAMTRRRIETMQLGKSLSFAQLIEQVADALSADLPETSLLDKPIKIPKLMLSMSHFELLKGQVARYHARTTGADLFTSLGLSHPVAFASVLEARRTEAPSPPPGMRMPSSLLSTSQFGGLSKGSLGEKKKSGKTQTKPEPEIASGFLQHTKRPGLRHNVPGPERSIAHYWADAAARVPTDLRASTRTNLRQQLQLGNTNASEALAEVTRRKKDATWSPTQTHRNGAGDTTVFSLPYSKDNLRTTALVSHPEAAMNGQMQMAPTRSAPSLPSPEFAYSHEGSPGEPSAGVTQRVTAEPITEWCSLEKDRKCMPGPSSLPRSSTQRLPLPIALSTSPPNWQRMYGHSVEAQALARDICAGSSSAASSAMLYMDRTDLQLLVLALTEDVLTPGALVPPETNPASCSAHNTKKMAQITGKIGGAVEGPPEAGLPGCTPPDPSRLFGASGDPQAKVLSRLSHHPVVQQLTALRTETEWLRGQIAEVLQEKEKMGVALEAARRRADMTATRLGAAGIESLRPLKARGAGGSLQMRKEKSEVWGWPQKDKGALVEKAFHRSFAKNAPPASGTLRILE